MTYSDTIPAPTAGWNTRDPLDGMDAHYALTLKNVIPETARVRFRNGFSVHGTGMGSGAVQSLHEYVTAAGVASLIAAANSKLYNATVAGAAVELGTGYSNNKWQGFTFNNVRLLMNGADQPQQWNGTALSNATYTGIADDNTIIQGTAYRSRVYMVPLNSTSIWYGAVNAITGALTEFPVAPLLRRGGYVMFVATWTRESGSALSEQFVICSSEGEVLIYSGASPDLDSWSLVGHVFLPKPLGRRAYLERGADLEIITRGGVVSLRRLLTSADVSLEAGLYTDAIQSTFNDAARLYGSNAGWEAVYYEKKNLLIYNVPTVDGTAAEQYVRNSLTGAWCQFTNQNACSWGTLGTNLYFGGPDGKVYKADDGQTDNSAAIPAEMEVAFNYLRTREQTKKFQMARPILQCTAGMSFGLGIDTDFQSNATAAEVTVAAVAGAEWDTASWDSGEWALSSQYITDWYDISGEGRAGALKLTGQFSNVSWDISAFHIAYDIGGVI